MKSEEKKIRVQLVDDHFFVRMGLADSLEDEDRIEVVAQSSSGEEAIADYREASPNVLVLDLQLPDMTGIDVIRKLKGAGLVPRVLMLTVNENEEEIYRAVEAGALGYLPKSTQRSELIEAIGEVSEGRNYFPDAIAEKLKARFNRTELTPREMELLRLIVAGNSNKEASAEMGISVATVKLHAGHIFEKLGVLDRTQAVTTAIRRGMVSLNE